MENLIHNMEIKEKIIKTNLAKYGCESPFGSKLIQEKSKQSMLERYGVENAIDIPLSLNSITVKYKIGNQVR